jgi:hypothetical protein
MGITGGIELPSDAFDIHAAQRAYSPDQKNDLFWMSSMKLKLTLRIELQGSTDLIKDGIEKW